MAQDHILVSCITREGEILNTLRRNLPNVIAVHVPHRTCGAFLAIVKMKKSSQGEPQQAIMAALGTEFYTKYVIVVDEDVDIFDMNDVMWAVATRVRAERDIVFIPHAKGAILDPSSDPEAFTVTKMGIDATSKARACAKYSRPRGSPSRYSGRLPGDNRFSGCISHTGIHPF
jgi:UbiD family decarboxylase